MKENKSTKTTKTKKNVKIKKKGTTVVKRKDSIRKQREDDCFMLSMLLSVTCLLLISLQSYQFNAFNHTITFSLLILPIIIFISNYITKKHDFKNSLNAIIISSLMMISFLILIKNLTNQQMNIMELVGNFTSYFVSLIINLCVYYYIVSNISSKSMMIILSYIFTLLIYSFLYIIFFNNFVFTNNLWSEFIISLIIQFIISSILIYFDLKIKRGTEV